MRRLRDEAKDREQLKFLQSQDRHYQISMKKVEPIVLQPKEPAKVHAPRHMTDQAERDRYESLATRMRDGEMISEADYDFVWLADQKSRCIRSRGRRMGYARASIGMGRTGGHYQP